jgi:transcriptional regulator with XRE-family HTH domain
MSFDYDAFFRALDQRRRVSGTTWRSVARDAGVSASSITRLGRGNSRPDLATVLSLASWAELDVNDFTGSTPHHRDLLSEVGQTLRSDPNLTPEQSSALEEMLRVTYTSMTSTSMTSTRTRKRRSDR